MLHRVKKRKSAAWNETPGTATLGIKPVHGSEMQSRRGSQPDLCGDNGKCSRVNKKSLPRASGQISRRQIFGASLPLSSAPEKNKGMAMLRRNAHFPLVQSPVLLALSLLAIPLLTWPIIQIAGDRGTFSFFVYIFLLWAGMILLLGRVGAAISRSGALNDGSDSAEHGKKDNQG